ncbi:MAG: chemotaxis protein CheC [Magnetococcales bacterium]|nr:chemotaxis protein CheC [Magnetococcales bacterium]
MISVLSELEQDALQEVLNLGMGQAASALAQLVNEEVHFTVPRLEFLPWHAVAERLAPDPMASLIGVRQRFIGPFHGSTLLVYPLEKSLQLVCALLGEEMDLKGSGAVERDTLTEVGNILLNACLGSLANLMEIEILCDLPEFLEGPWEAFLAGERHTEGGHETILLLYVEFFTRGNTVQGYVVLLFDAWAVSHLQRELADVLHRYEG